MSKAERLNARVGRLLAAAVQEVLQAVRETVSEYQEKTARTQRENQRLKKRLLELQAKSDHKSGDGQVVCTNYKQTETVEFSLRLESSIDPKIKDPKHHPEDLLNGEGQDGETYENPAVVSHLGPVEPTLITVKTLSEPVKTESWKTSSIDILASDSSGSRLHIVNDDNNVLAPINHHFSSTKEVKTEFDPGEVYKVYEERGLVCEAGTFANSVPSEMSLSSSSSLPPPLTAFCASKPTGHVETEAEGVDASFQRPDLYRRGVTGSPRIHGRLHRAEKRYFCTQCGRAFSHAGDFKKHRRVHTGEKPYLCTVCGKRFSQSGYLTVHLRYHTGERPYGCALCGKRFSHSSNCRKHEQSHCRVVTIH